MESERPSRSKVPNDTSLGQVDLMGLIKFPLKAPVEPHYVTTGEFNFIGFLICWIICNYYNLAEKH